MRTAVKHVMSVVAYAGFLCAAFLVAICMRPRQGFSERSPRLIWGTTPIINFSYWSRAMKQAGFSSETVVAGTYKINQDTDWDIIVPYKYRGMPHKMLIAFIVALYRYDVFFMSFDGFLGYARGSRYEMLLLKLAGKKVVLLPYGGDSYVYSKVHSPLVAHGLMMSYPGLSREQARLDKRVRTWTSLADVVLPGGMAFDGFGRWDVLQPSILTVDTERWARNSERRMHDGRTGPVVIVHAPNHRGFKGTEFILEAVERLESEGLDLDFRLLEGVPNDVVHRVLTEEADILADQLLFTGYALNAIEGLASGVVVLSNLSDDSVCEPLRWFTYFSECPIVCATPADVTDVLRALITRPDLRAELAIAGRSYAEKYHSADSAVHLFTRVLEYLRGDKGALANLYHPILGEYTNRSPKIHHPLVRNRIPDTESNRD